MIESNNVKKFRILIADSNDSILTVFRIFESELNELEPNTYDCDYANTGVEVLDKIQKDKYDLLITDYYLQGKNGVEILEFIALNNLNLPVIFQTQRGSEEIAMLGLKLGLKDYFIKSRLSFEELYSSIVNILRKENDLPALLSTPEIPALNFLAHHMESVIKGYQQEITEADLVPGQEYIFAFMSVKISHDYNMEEYLSYDAIKAILQNAKNFVLRNCKESYGMKWIDKEDFLMHTFVGRNLITNCFTCAVNCLIGMNLYNLANYAVHDNVYLTITLNFGEAKYEPNKEVLISSALNYNVHSIQKAEDPGLYVSEYFYANMDDKAKSSFKTSFVLEDIQNFRFTL